MNKKRKYVKTRHQVIVKVAKFIAAPFLRAKVGIKIKPFDLKPYGPCLIVSNHVNPIDPILITDTFGQQIYYIASEIIFSNGLISRLLEFCFAPIPKMKSQTDVGAIKEMITIAKQGGSVAVFVEGNSSFNGGPYPFEDSIGKLVLKLKLPLVIFNIKGGYLTKPRWSVYPKRGLYTGGVREIIPYENYKDMSAEEISKLIREKIDVNAYRDSLDIDYKGKKRAEGLQRLLFTCPECHTPNSVFTKGHYYYCDHCGLKAEYTVRGYLDIPTRGKVDLITLDNENLTHYESYLKKNPTFALTYEGSLIHIYKRRRVQRGRALITLDKDGLTIVRKNGNEITQHPFATISAIAVQQQALLLIYIDGQPTIGFRLNKFDSPYQMMKTYEILKKFKQGE
jgi:1-acyl-sn-glycerol-3-phosphate acyltransferase